MRFGIDFGTTTTVVAACDRGNYPVVSFEGHDGEASEGYPSLVAERQGRLLYGLDAAAHLDDPRWTIARSFKRLLAHPRAGLEQPVRVGTSELTLIELVTGFLTTLRRDLIERSNVPVSPGPGERIEAAIATPANARSPQRLITLDAFRAAGFDVLAMLDEPSAAGVEYAHRYANTLTAARQRVAVYDLGGGTFDASVIDMRARTHEVVASAGEPQLGGDDFDEALAALALARQRRTRESLSAAQYEALVASCREQKERLHPNSRRLLVETDRGAVDIPVETYYEAITPLIDRTLATLESAVAGGGTDGDEIAGIYVVGGASQLPAVGRALRARFGRRVHRSPYPSAAAAIGLAIAYDPASGYTVHEPLARCFGVFREATDGGEVSFDPIFTTSTRRAEREGMPPQVVRAYRPRHNIGHFRFVECSGVDAGGAPDGDVWPVGDVRFPFDPAIRGGRVDLKRVPVERIAEEGAPIEERYTVGPTGIVGLEIVEPGTGYARRFRIGELASMRQHDAGDGASQIVRSSAAD